MLNNVNGIPIFYNALCLEATMQPVREYRKRRWQTEAQAARKRKKWIKRFGFVQKPCIWRTPTAFFAHPSFKPQIEAALLTARAKGTGGEG